MSKMTKYQLDHQQLVKKKGSKKMNKCSKCNSSNITYRINYDFGEEWNEDRDNNVIYCLDCGHEIDDNTNIKK